MITPQIFLEKYSDFQVLNLKSLYHELNILQGLGNKVPVHNMILCTMKTRTQIFTAYTSDMEIDQKFYKLNKIPTNFMLLPFDRIHIDYLIYNIEQCRENQQEIDNCYSKIQDFIDEKMKSQLPMYRSRTNKKFKISKPYWNNDLKHMWKNLVTVEKRCLKCNMGSFHKNLRRKEFVTLSKLFEHELHKAE